jgi:hypothetical protein
MKHRKKYLLHAKQIEEMFCSICHKALELAKSYMPESVVVQQVGSMEAINVAEFKQLGPMDYNIKVEPMNDDLDDTFARYLVTRDSLQYSGKDVSPAQKARIMSQFPWVNTDEMYGHELIDDKESENILLALDRGEFPPISEFDENKEVIKSIVRRRRKADWHLVKNEPSKIPNPQTGQPLSIEETYQLQYQHRVKIMNAEMDKVRNANAGLIPMGGPLVDVGVYTNEPKKDGSGVKTVRMKLPQDMINWVVKRASEQGVAVQQTEDMPDTTKAQIIGGGNTAA